MPSPPSMFPAAASHPEGFAPIQMATPAEPQQAAGSSQMDVDQDYTVASVAKKLPSAVDLLQQHNRVFCV